MEQNQIQNQNQNQNLNAAPAPAALVKEEKGRVAYTANGQEVKLSYQIVRDFLVKGGGNVSDQDLVQFISICKYNQLNPFLNEAYLVKYGSQPTTMVVSKEALMKRAEACPDYDGIEAGVIVMRDGKPVDVEGCFVAPGDTLVGGWAKVWRGDRRMPYVSRVNLSEYDSQQALWKSKKATMISKVAKVQALREAFPSQLGAMYTREEQGLDETPTPVAQEIRTQANQGPVIGFAPAQEVAAPEGTTPQQAVPQPQQAAPTRPGRAAGPGF